MTKQIYLDGLPESDRVFLLDTGDYVRSRFRLKRSAECCHSCGRTRIGEGSGIPMLTILITVATCDEHGEILRDEDGKPQHVMRCQYSIAQELVKDKTRQEIFTMAKEYALPLMAGEIQLRRQFPTIEPELDEDLV